MPESTEPPAQRPTDRPEPNQARSPSRQLPGAEALVRDGPVPVDLAVPHVPVRCDDLACGREEERDRQLRDRVGVASRSAQHGDAGGGGRGDIDIGRVPPAAGDGDEGLFVERVGAAVALDHHDVRSFGRDPLRELLGVVDPQRRLLEPRVGDQLGKLGEQLEPGTPDRRGDERLRACRHERPVSFRSATGATVASAVAVTPLGVPDRP